MPTDQLASDYSHLRRDAAYRVGPGHGLVVVRGLDAQSFLQSLVSQDLDPLGDGAGAHSLLLQPQGKLVSDFRLLRVSADEWWCDGERASIDDLAAGLARFKIRVKVDIDDVSDSSALLSVRGPDAVVATSQALGVAIGDAQHADAAVGAARVVRADWGAIAGVDVVGPAADVDAARASLEAASVPEAGVGAFEVLRIESGVPRQGLDLDERTIAQEAFLDETAVSFTKGCFVGQELVCRIDTRGHVNRYLRRLRIDNDVVGVGAELFDGDKAVGVVTSATPHPDGGTVALAMVRREIEPPATLAVRGAGEHTATATVEPLHP